MNPAPHKGQLARMGVRVQTCAGTCGRPIPGPRHSMMNPGPDYWPEGTVCQECHDASEGRVQRARS